MKERLDVLLVQKGLAPSREKAKTMIMEGNVFVDHQREDKAGTFFDPSVNIEIHGNTLRYVSRHNLALYLMIKYVWILEHLPVDLPIACCKMVQVRCMR